MYADRRPKELQCVRLDALLVRFELTTTLRSFPLVLSASENP